MKRMSFARRNAYLPRSVSTATVALIAIVAVLVFIRVIFPGALSSLLAPVALVSNLAASTASDAVAPFTDSVTLHDELDAARVNNAVLMEQNAALTARVADLERLLGNRTEPAESILAAVVSRPPMSPYDTLLLDQGMSSGVQVGAIVTGPAGTPIGSIASVTQHSSRALLYSAPGIETSAWIGETRIPVTMLGIGGGAFDAEAPKESGIAEGDAVYVANGGAVRVGIIARIDSDPATPSVTLRIVPAVNPYSLTWVMIAPAAL